MTFKTGLMIAACALALGACSQEHAPSAVTVTPKSGYSGGMEVMADMADMAPQPIAQMKSRDASSGKMSSTPRPRPDQQSTDNPTSQSYLAYRYTYGFSLPVKAVAATAQSHMQICMDAGPDICQVLGSNTNAQSAEYVTANLRLRAAPVWLEQYKDTLTSSVAAAEGKTLNAGVTAEDLTRQIVDTDSRLKAQTLLRTRLEGLLETRNAKLPDLLSLERELARVQQQIESATTTLNVLKKRVSMSEVNINYQTIQKIVTRKSVSPIGRAIKNFTHNFSNAMASVIGFIAAVLPWMIILIPGVWFIRRWWRKRTPKIRKNLPARTPKS